MPTYEYRCPDGHEFEHFVQKISQASSELPCPVCGKVAARRMSAGAGLVFKGSGFYITDYGKDGKKDQRDDAERRKKSADKAEAASVGDGAKTEGMKAEPAKGEGAKSEAQGEGSKSDAKREGAKGDAKGEGAKRDVKGEGAKRDAKGEGAKRDAKKAVAAPPPKGGGKE